MVATNLRSALTSAASAEKAGILSRFFKTGAGEYGEGDKFLGLTVPTIRRYVGEYWRATTWPQLDSLITSPYHELRLAALLVLVKKYEKGDASDQEQIYRYYLAHTRYINNWDLVDLSAPNILGAHLLGKDHAVLYDLAHSDSLWERRIGILSTFTFIRAGDMTDTIGIATILLHDQHDLIHKAVGWMLREMGKRDMRSLLTFLDTHAPTMPRTMLRYAIEKLSPAKRHYYILIK